MSDFGRLRFALLAALGGVCLLGCGAMDDLAGGDLTADGGGRSGVDAGAPPPMTADGGLGDTPDAAPTKPGGRFEADAADIGACYDGIDNEDDGAFDCTDDACASVLPSCCVGRTRGGACCEGVPTRLGPIAPGASCTGEGCLDGTGMTTFGVPLPWASAGRLYPGGDSTGDSGAISAISVDLATTRLTLEATLGPGDCGSTTCTEAIGVAVTAQQTLEEGSVVRPIAGVLVSGARRTVNLIVNGAIAWSAPVPEGPEATYTLVLDPAGEVRLVGVEGAPVVRFVPEANARIVVYGRSRNPSVRTDGAYLARLDVTESVCDIPSAWGARAALAITDGAGELTADVVRGPSVLDHEGRSWLAYERQNSIYLAGETMAGGWNVVPGTLLIGRSTSWDVRVRDPELVAHPSGGFALYYTGIDADGKARIGLATSGDATPGNFRAEDDPVIALEGDGESVDAPTVIAQDGAWVMLARIRHADGRSELGRWSSPDGRAWSPEGASFLTTATARDPRGPADAFDAHEIAAPAIVRVHGSWQLYYAGRSGSRWGIGVLVSDDLLHWRAEGGGAPVLAADGSGFDAFGVADPELRNDGTHLELFYAGSDGTRSRLGSTWRAVPETVLGGAGGGR